MTGYYIASVSWGKDSLFAIDGEREYKAACKEINGSLKLIGSRFPLPACKCWLGTE